MTKFVLHGIATWSLALYSSFQALATRQVTFKFPSSHPFTQSTPMKLFLHALATLALVEGSIFENKENLQFCRIAGGPHGDPFDDTLSLAAGQSLTAIKLCSGHRVDGIGVSILSTDNTLNEPFHGSDKNCQTYNLAPNEHITSFEVHTARHHKKTRVSYVNFINDEGHSYEGGRMSDDEKKMSGCKAPDGYHLGGFYGRDGNEIDAIAPIWVPIDPIQQSNGQYPANNQLASKGTSSQYQDDDSSDDYK